MNFLILRFVIFETIPWVRLNPARMNAMRFSLLLTMALAAPAWSAIVFTNLGPGDSYSGGGQLVASDRWIASDFVPSASGALTSIRIPLFENANPSSDVVISLREPGADPSGAVLESWSLPPSDVGTLEVLPSLLNPALTAGSTYWLAVSTNASGGYYVWNNNITGDEGLAASTNQGSTWDVFPMATAGAFEVNARAQVIPEPSAFALVIAGGLCLVLRRHWFANRQSPNQLKYFTPTSSTWPSTWPLRGPLASAQKAAFRLCGVVYDPQQDALIIPVSEGIFSS